MTVEYKIRIEPSFVDKRGTITNVLEFVGGAFKVDFDQPAVRVYQMGAPIEHVAFITSRKKSVRGNHYHKLETQYIYLVRGEFMAYSVDVSDLETTPLRQAVEMATIGRLHVLPGELLVTPPNVAHAHVYLKDSMFVNMNTAPRKRLEQEDTFPFIVMR